MHWSPLVLSSNIKIKLKSRFRTLVVVHCETDCFILTRFESLMERRPALFIRCIGVDPLHQKELSNPLCFIRVCTEVSEQGVQGSVLFCIFLVVINIKLVVQELQSCYEIFRLDGHVERVAVLLAALVEVHLGELHE